MEMPTAESALIRTPKLRWLERERESGRIYDWATIASGVILAGTLTLGMYAAALSGIQSKPDSVPPGEPAGSSALP